MNFNSISRLSVTMQKVDRQYIEYMIAFCSHLIFIAWYLVKDRATAIQVS